MGKQSTRENKTIYQICREEAGLTRSEASEKMTAVSDSKIEKFEYEMQDPTPYDIIQMADAYKCPELCNYFCSHKCEIGHRYVPERLQKMICPFFSRTSPVTCTRETWAKLISRPFPPWKKRSLGVRQTVRSANVQRVVKSP